MRQLDVQYAARLELMISVRWIVKFAPVTPQSPGRVPEVTAGVLAGRAAPVAARGELGCRCR